MDMMVCEDVPNYSSITMTQLEPTLMLCQMTVFSNGKVVYDQIFHSGVNIIRGANSSGKSTIADFIFFGLGGDLSTWKAEAELCSEVFLEVSVNGAALTLRRAVTKASRQPMMIYWGDMAHAKASAGEGWQIFSFQRTEERQSFSQVLFRALGFPEVRSDMESNITMHQILRLIYVDQLSLVEDLMRTEHFDTPLTREAVRDLLFGVYDDTLYRCEIKLRDKRRELDKAETEYNSAIGVLQQTGHELDLEKVNIALGKTTKFIAELQNAIDEASKSDAASQNESRPFGGEDLSITLMDVRKDREECEKGIRTLELDIEDSREFITMLENRIADVGESILTREVLGDLPLTRCPHCLKTLELRPSNDVCFLCKQSISDTVGRSQAMRMRQELVFQHRESESLLKDKESRLTQLIEELPARVEKERSVQRQFDAMMSTVRTSRDQYLDALFVEKGTQESQLQFFHMQAKAIGVLERLKLRIGNLKSDIRRIDLEILTKQKNQESKKGEAFEVIHDLAVELLKADLPREEAFQTAKKVAFDFRRNTFAVDGRNQFSASSISYLKNCIHYAIFFASLRLPFFRYPRLIICDNMEDKGMESERSQNFQRVIVSLSTRAVVTHQIIFTTSMIDSALDRSELCVGPHYNQNAKSLSLS